MEEIAKIIVAINKELGVDKTGILTGKNHAAVYARKILCHIIKTDYPDSIEALARLTKHTLSACYRLAKIAEDQLRQDVIFIRHVNNVRRHLYLKPVVQRRFAGNPKVVEKEKKKEKPTTYKNPFGITYTELDELKIKFAKQSAARYMKSYGKGMMPLCEGYATKRISFN